MTTATNGNHLPPALLARHMAWAEAERAATEAAAEAGRLRKAARAARAELDRSLAALCRGEQLHEQGEFAFPSGPDPSGPDPSEAPPRSPGANGATPRGGSSGLKVGDRVRLAIDDVEPVSLGTVKAVRGLVNGQAAVEVEWDNQPGETTHCTPADLVRADLSAEVRLPVPPVRVPANEVDAHRDWCRWEGGIHGLYAAARAWTDEQLAEALRRFWTDELIAEADAIRGEQNRREKVAAGELKPKPEDAERGADRPWHACPKCGGTGRVCRRCKRSEARITLKQDYCHCTAPDFDLCAKCGGNGREYEKPRKARKPKAPPKAESPLTPQTCLADLTDHEDAADAARALAARGIDTVADLLAKVAAEKGSGTFGSRLYRVVRGTPPVAAPQAKKFCAELGDYLAEVAEQGEGDS